jgi:hypothetical protein
VESLWMAFGGADRGRDRDRDQCLRIAGYAVLDILWCLSNDFRHHYMCPASTLSRVPAEKAMGRALSRGLRPALARSGRLGRPFQPSCAPGTRG